MFLFFPHQHLNEKINHHPQWPETDCLTSVIQFYKLPAVNYRWSKLSANRLNVQNLRVQFDKFVEGINVGNAQVGPFCKVELCGFERLNEI